MVTSPSNFTLHRYKCSNKGYTEDLGDGVTLTLMLTPAGEFTMGAPESEPDSKGTERPQRLMRVPKFLMGRYPVTQAQWRVVAGYEQEDRVINPNPSRFKGDDFPVEQVSWFDVVEFCKRLSKRTKKNYHLPSEAQWEYACRAETETAYHFGEQIATELANCYMAVGKTTAVKSYAPNRWGLYDMHGNVWEWCQDHWHDNYERIPTDSSAWVEDGNLDLRILRGGSWFNNPKLCRSAARYSIRPDDINYDIGFRVCCSAPERSGP